MKTWIHNNKQYLRDHAFLISVAVALLFLAGSLVVNFYAGLYATERASSSVTDLILSNIPVFDVDGLFTYGSVIFWIFVSLLCLSRPNTIPFMLKSVTLFILIRSVFITLTHIWPFPTHVFIASTNIIQGLFTFGGDLFFSAHTGLPFLLALLFWESPMLRYVFIALSILFGIVVLLAHLHYSIDVLGAFFITYTIYHLACRFFKKDKQLFDRGLAHPH